MKRGPRKSPRNPASTAPGRSSGTLWQLAVVTIAILGAAAWFLAAEHEIAGRWGFPLDDSWIYATFARNVAEGHGYSFNPGETISGATGPLYVFLLSALYLAFHDVIWSAKVLGLLCLIGSSLLLFRATRQVLPGNRLAPLIVGLLTGLSPPLLWGSLSGLELPVYLLVVCIGIDFYVRRKWAMAALFWCVGVWLRPDGLFLVFLAAALHLRGRPPIAPWIMCGLVVGSYFVFNVLVGGSLLPTSVSVKAHLFQNLLANETGMVKQWADLWGISPPKRVGLHMPILLAGLAVGSFLLVRRIPAVPIYALLFPFIFGLSGASGGQFARYIVYVVPFTLLLAVAGIQWAAQRLPRSLAVLLLIGAGCLAWEVYVDHKAGIGHGWNVQNINGMQRYIAETTQRAVAPGDTVAVNDVGAMGFFSGCYVVDLVGLVSAKRSFPENLRLYHPKYLALFPDWFQSYARVDWRTDQVVFFDADSVYEYSPFLGVRLQRNTISSRNTMYVYERMPKGETGVEHVPIVVH